MIDRDHNTLYEGDVVEDTPAGSGCCAMTASNHADCAGDGVIMSIAGHVSLARVSRYSHLRIEAKRRALDQIAARQRAADEKRKAEAERQRQAEMVSEQVVVQ